MVIIMKPSHCATLGVRLLLLPFLIQLVVTSQVEGRLGSGQRACPPGQVIHVGDHNQLRCCLPVDCGINHFVKFCTQNGTQDVCEPCPRNYALFKRTSSFAYDNCQIFPLVIVDCSPLPGNPKATEEDTKNCYCDLEKGLYYLKPQVALGRTSFCQPFHNYCRKGQQPTQEGACEDCSRNTVQDKDESFDLCRPQRNCSAMGVATLEVGTSEKEAVCARPPTPPSHRPLPTSDTTTTPVVPLLNPTTRKADMAESDKEPAAPSARPVLNAESSAKFTSTHIAVLSVSGVVLLILIIIASVYARRKGWCSPRSVCQRHFDLEDNRNYHHHHHHLHTHHHPGPPLPPHSQHSQCHNGSVCDNDNASDDSCCACADSCLASSSSKSSGSAHRNGPKSAGACAPPCKHPMQQGLDGYMNGKCGELSEPLYNSISHDGSKLCSGDGDLATYQNVGINGIHPTMLTTGQQQDYGKEFDYNYPSKVHLPSMESEDDHSLKKGGLDPSPATAKGKEASVAAMAKDHEDFSETDPLLPNLEVVPCGLHHPHHPTTVGAPLHLRGILRNGSNARGSQEAGLTTTTTTRNGDGREVGGGGGSSRVDGVGVVGGPSGGGGNRPNLSMLLSSVDSSAAASSPRESGTGGLLANGQQPGMAANLPYLSQLVSTSSSSSPHNAAVQQRGVGGSAVKVQHQQLQQAAEVAEPPQQHVHELPPQLQRHLLLQQQQHHQQQQQEGSTLPLRLVPTTTATARTAATTTAAASHLPLLTQSPQLGAPNLVQMDELKPAMSLHPSPTSPTSNPPPPHQPANGAANIKEQKDPRTGSPARIDPSQQKEVRRGGGVGKGREDSLNREGKLAKVSENGDGAELLRSGGVAVAPPPLDDETLRKEAVLRVESTSPTTRTEGVEEEEEETARKSVGGSSGLGESLDLSSPLSLPQSEDGRRSRSMYRRSNSEASRSVSPQLPLPPSRSISSPGDRNRPYAVVKPMQSDQSLDTLSSSPDNLRELTRPLDSANLQYPLTSMRLNGSAHTQSSQESSDEHEDIENA